MRDLDDRRFTGLLEAAPDAMVCVDAAGQIALVNAQAERLFGYRRDELIGQPVEILVPDTVRPVHPGHRAGYVADPRPRPMGAGMELAGRRRDGSTFPAEISLSAIDAGEGVLVTAAVRDVTDRRRAAEAAGRLASIIQSSHDAVIGKTVDQVITSRNPAAERLYGYTAEEMIGTHVQVLFPGSEREHERAMLAAVVRGERVEEHRTRRVRKGGSVVPVSLTLSPITDASGKITGISTVARDVTERQRAEARFTGLLEAAPDAMVCADAGGRIALVNAAAERLFGYRRDELVGQPDDGLLVTAAIRDITDRLEAQAEQERLRTQAERGRLERQLQQSQRLESLGQLAGGVAHDFNNLLGVISNYAAFVAEELNKLPDQQPAESVVSDIEQIQRAAERAARLTHQLLAFARREVIRPRVLILNTIVTSVLELLQRTLGEHVVLITDLDPGLDHVLADPGHIEQILINLAVNARDAMTGGGTLTIHTSNADIDEAYVDTHANLSLGRYVKLQLADNGPGMPPDVIDHAFEPFFTTKPKGEGTGLGLATIYGIVIQAGGNVRIYSEPDLGTVVTVLLPVTSQPPAAADQPSDALTGGAGETILVVEDEPAMREVTRRILARTGYSVIAAGNGQEAITAAATTDHIDVLLTDVIMPGMQGREVAERIRDHQPGTAVLYMSGYTQGILGAQGVLEPQINLIEKPFTEASLLQKIRAIISNPGAAPPDPARRPA